MEIKPTIITLFLLLLIAVPCFSRGGLMYMQKVDSGIYDIDYRGPETHSYLPPPDRSNVKPDSHQEGVMAHSRSKGLRSAGNIGGASGKKIHG